MDEDFITSNDDGQGTNTPSFEGNGGKIIGRIAKSYIKHESHDWFDSISDFVKDFIDGLSSDDGDC